MFIVYMKGYMAFDRNIDIFPNSQPNWPCVYVGHLNPVRITVHMNN